MIKRIAKACRLHFISLLTVFKYILPQKLGSKYGFKGGGGGGEIVLKEQSPFVGPIMKF